MTADAPNVYDEGGVTKAAAVLVLLLGSRAAVANVAIDERPPPALRLAIDNVLVGRVNPLALADLVRIGLAAPLYRRAEPVLRDNFLFFGASPRFTASSLRVGPELDVQPLSILSLRLSAELVHFWGIFDSIQSFATPTADWSDSAISRGGDAGLNYPTDGVHVVFEPTLQLRWRMLALRDHAAVEYWNLRLRRGDGYFYEAGADTLVPNGGMVVSNDLDVAWVTRWHFAIAARYTIVVPLYTSQPSGLNRQQRLGPAIAYTFLDRRFTRFHSVTLFGVAAWYLEHRFRTGADVSVAVPYLLGGVSFTSDIILAP